MSDLRHAPLIPADVGHARGADRHRDVAAARCLPNDNRPGPNSSIERIINLPFRIMPTTRDGLVYDGDAIDGRNGGYSSQVMRVWNTDCIWSRRHAVGDYLRLSAKPSAGHGQSPT